MKRLPRVALSGPFTSTPFKPKELIHISSPTSRLKISREIKFIPPLVEENIGEEP